MPQQGSTSPKTRRGQAVLETPVPVESTPVAKQHLSEREGGDIDIGILDQEAFARVIASGQANQVPSSIPQMGAMEEEEEEGNEVVDDAIYRPSGVQLPEDADPIWSLRLTCLPVLDIFVCFIIPGEMLILEYGVAKDPVFTSTFYDPSNCHRDTRDIIKSQL
jgi:hypothetical protein